MALKFTEDQKRTLMLYEKAQRSHIAAWESGICPGRKWIGAVCRATGMRPEQVWSKYPVNHKGKKAS